MKQKYQMSKSFSVFHIEREDESSLAIKPGAVLKLSEKDIEVLKRDRPKVAGRMKKLPAEKRRAEKQLELSVDPECRECDLPPEDGEELCFECMDALIESESSHE